MTDHLKENQNEILPVSGDEEGFDAAGRSLTNALRVSFSILKVIMIILVLVFLASGIFRVEPNEQALVLRMGKIRGIGEERVLNPGLQRAWPEPINEIVKIPSREVLTLPVESFWYFLTPQQKLTGNRGRVGRTLDPTRDGYCLTRNDNATGANDYNIVHGMWQVTYRIDDTEKFFRNVDYGHPQPGQDFSDVMAGSVNPLLEAMADNAIVATMVNYSIEQAIVSSSNIPNDIERLLQAKLDRIDSGIVVEAVQTTEHIIWPRQVDSAFQESNKASQESQRLITSAKGDARETLSQTGGADTEGILAMLKDPDISVHDRDVLLFQLTGTSREKIADAHAYKAKIVGTARANAEYLQKLLPEYRKRPRLVVQKIYQDAVEEVMNNAEEKIFIQPSIGGKAKELRVLINRDPAIKKTSGQQEETKQ